MQRYSAHQPTAFDPSGAFLPERQDWLVAPVSQTRDSGPLAQSNFATFLEALEGESDTVEVHRFGHWGPGWYEIILIDPSDLERVAAAERMEEALADYPVLDDEDFSRREYEEYERAWDSYGYRDFLHCLRAEFDCERVLECVEDATVEALREFYESCLPSGEYFHGDDVSLNTRAAAQNCTRTDLARFARTVRNAPVSA